MKIKKNELVAQERYKKDALTGGFAKIKEKLTITAKQELLKDLEKKTKKFNSVIYTLLESKKSELIIYFVVDGEYEKKKTEFYNILNSYNNLADQNINIKLDLLSGLN